MKLLLTLVCLVGAASLALGEVKPKANAREQFATNFYRMIVYKEKSAKRNFVTSPAAVQKLLVAVYNGAEDELADNFLWDLYLKGIDIKRILEEGRLAGDLDPLYDIRYRETQINEQREHIPRDVILNYFKNDFAEVSKEVFSENYFVAPKDFKYSKEFTKFVQEYFPTTLLYKNPGEVSEAEKKFGVTFNNTNELEILTANTISAKWQQAFTEDAGVLSTQGTFKFGDLSWLGLQNYKVVELPLVAEKPLSIQIILPTKKRDLEWFVSQSVGKSVDDFNGISNQLKEQLVTVKLPKFKIEAITNLATYFSENTYKGIHDLYTQNVQLNRLFENLPASGIKASSFVLKSAVEFSANGIGSFEDPLPVPQGYKEPTQIFDALNEFFFVIKSDKTIYFMGHYSS